jgi:hypothetical protein
VIESFDFRAEAGRTIAPVFCTIHPLSVGRLAIQSHGFADRGKAAPQAKAEIRRPRGRFAEDFAGECAKAGAAVCAAAIDAEQEDIRVHGPDIPSGTVSKAFISELRAIHLDVEQRR